MDVSKLSLNIEKVLGSSVTKIELLAHAKGCLLYAAGNLIVFYSPILDEQITYISHTSDTISAIAISPDEQYLAVCDSGKLATTSVYDINDLEAIKGRPDVKWVLRGHKKCIDHVIFSGDSRYLVTVSNQDGSMFTWEGAEAVTKNRNSKSISKMLFDSKGDLITVGRGYIKLWPFKERTVIKKVQGDQHIMQGKSLSFGKKFSTQDFVDAALLVRNNIQKLVLLSSEGLICIISSGYEKTEKWIDVMMQGAVSISLVDSVALCCGDHALVKAVDIEKLQFKGKFPKPPPTARENLTEQEPLECMENDEFPKCLGVRRVDQFIVTLYSSRSLFVWRMEQDGDIQAVRSILSPRAKVTCIKILDEVEGGELTFFATASDDHTVRLWHCYGKQTSAPRKSIDVGALLGLKRNVYCRHLTHIIYTHSEHPVTQIKPFEKNSIVCLAHNELLIYSLENFGLTLLECFENEKIICLQTAKQLILLATHPNKIKIFENKDEKLEEIRQLTIQNQIERIFVSNDRLIINGKGIARITSLEGNSLLTYYKSDKIGIAGNYLLSCEKKVLNVYSLLRNKRTASITLSHQLDQNQLIKTVKSNSWLIVVITSKNRLLLLNFSAAVLYSQEMNSFITDVQITEQGKIMMSTQSGVIFIRNQSTTAKYKQIDQKVQKWFQQNDMNWMDGSVWASKHKIDRSHSLSGKSQDLLKAKSVDEQKRPEKQKLPELKIEDSIKLGGGNWADLSLSLKKPEAFNDRIMEYKNEQNKRSIFNPSSICAQVNKIYKDVDAIQKRNDQQKPPLAATNKQETLLSDFPLMIDDRNESLHASKSRKKIFNHKDREDYYPKFSNSLVESIIDPPKQKTSTQVTEQHNTSRQQQSIDFNLSQYESKPTEQHHDISKTKELPLKPELIHSLALLLQLPEEMQTHQNLVSLILEHSQEYQALYKLLDKVYGKEERSSQRSTLLRKMQIMWEEMKSTVEKQL